MAYGFENVSAEKEAGNRNVKIAAVLLAGAGIIVLIFVSLNHKKQKTGT